MNKHIIMQKILNNDEVSDELFRKICQFLDIVDSNDVEKIIETFKKLYPESEKIEENPTENDPEIGGDDNENSETGTESQDLNR